MTRDDNASFSEKKFGPEVTISDSGNQLTNLTIHSKFTMANRLSKKYFKRRISNFSSCVYFNFNDVLDFLIENYKILRLLVDKFIIYNVYLYIRETEVGIKISMKLSRSRDILLLKT